MAARRRRRGMRARANSRRRRCSGWLARCATSLRSTPLDRVSTLRQERGEAPVADEVHGADDDEHILVAFEHPRQLLGPARVATVDQCLRKLGVTLEVVFEASLESRLVAPAPGIEHRLDEGLDVVCLLEGLQQDLVLQPGRQAVQHAELAVERLEPAGLLACLARLGLDDLLDAVLGVVTAGLDRYQGN